MEAITYKGGAVRCTLQARRRLSGPAIRTFTAIADGWGLSLVERRGLLGNPSNFALRRWQRKAGDHCAFSLTAGVLMKLSVILGIHRALMTLFSTGHEARDWLHGLHQAPPFTGRRPLDLMIGGDLDGLLAVRRFLNAARLGIYMLPRSIDEDFQPYDDDEIVIVEMKACDAPAREMISVAEIALIESAFPPSEARPEFDVPRLWSNPSLTDPETIIALVLENPTTEDLARTIVSYGPRRVIAMLERWSASADLSIQRLERARSWLGPVLNGVAEAAREILSIPSDASDQVSNVGGVDAELVEKLKAIAAAAKAGESVEVTGLPRYSLRKLLFPEGR